ncbi:GTPase-activating protein gyp8 [Exophiala sideris]|uniref:GTPase-activating protein gyp8 n=1 Tax=Exophiala sideris TaxID=1016849 RepID=A0ABR0J380_9EURO|nr:GTPase-activating protein gyp8 [Exophiala sideris]KAK5033710.1 GTPase-activating protein gyp8 [Exophiala sideris]KAK5055533.1 GTPase-activating protein gyp8 [Exophiala sideris]KAK5180084.1 GTPase-activating protein gyp8 [Eurotiomycetes sp. CCFEE 6388]
MQTDESEQSLDKRKTELSNLIVSTLRSHPMLSYFQSYHDVVQVLLLVLGEHHAAVAVPRISLLRLRDYMLPTISPARKHFELVSAIVKAADPELADHIAEAENSFALSATHSLFAHDIQNYGDIARVYDFLLSHEPVMSLYLFATITISRRAELLEMPADESDILTFMISKLPQTLDIDELIQNTLTLFRNHPPAKLPGFCPQDIKKRQSTTQPQGRRNTMPEADPAPPKGRTVAEESKVTVFVQKTSSIADRHVAGWSCVILVAKKWTRQVYIVLVVFGLPLSFQKNLGNAQLIASGNNRLCTNE